MPKFIVSNADIACSPEFLRNIQSCIAKEFGLRTNEVEINTIFKGGYIMQHYGDPKNDYGNKVVGIQIEYNRGLIMDQATRIPNKEKLKEFNEKFRKVMEKACELL